jgi:hypothetical protein
VQALALLACESFGASVAMSAESCHKVNLLCNRSHESAFLSFLKSRIGYRKGDCGWQLAQSDAGSRFLGLAACLNTIDSWNAAIILHELIYTTATDKKLVPTSQHLKQLMQAVEDRLAKSGFAESALGWALIFSNETETSGDVQSPQLLIGEKHCTMAPSAKTVVGLTKAMSSLARVGEEVQRIEIATTIDHAAWLVAFVKWSLGAPPAIVLCNGRTLAPETDLRVILRLVKNTGKAQEVRVDIYDYTGKIMNFVRDVPSLAEFKGLVSVGIYGETMLRRLFDYSRDPKYRACLQALPYACVLVRQNLVVRNEWSTAKISTADLDQWVDPETRLTKGQVFPSVEKISHVLHNYLGGSREEAPPNLSEISSVETVEDLSLVSLVKSRMAQVCTCQSCQNTSTKTNTYCKFQRFLSDVSLCVAHVLAISLLNAADPGGAQVYFGSKISGPFLQCVQSILSGKKPPECSVSDVLEIAVQMVGHDLSDKHAWVMSSRYDQTVFPQILSTQTIQSEGILSLECIPGILMWDELRYNSVLVSRLYRQWDFDDEDPSTEITAKEGSLYQQVKLEDGVAVYPKDSFPGLKVKWQVGLKENDVEVAVVIPKFATLPGRNPRYVLDSAAESLFVNCTHDRMARFTPHTGNIYTTQPLDPRPQSRDPNSIGIVQQ